jgi:hypothetical protein
LSKELGCFYYTWLLGFSRFGSRKIRTTSTYKIGRLLSPAPKENSTSLGR